MRKNTFYFTQGKNKTEKYTLFLLTLILDIFSILYVSSCSGWIWRWTPEENVRHSSSFQRNIRRWRGLRLCHTQSFTEHQQEEQTSQTYCAGWGFFFNSHWQIFKLQLIQESLLNINPELSGFNKNTALIKKKTKLIYHTCVCLQRVSILCDCPPCRGPSEAAVHPGPWQHHCCYRNWSLHALQCSRLPCSHGALVQRRVPPDELLRLVQPPKQWTAAHIQVQHCMAEQEY